MRCGVGVVKVRDRVRVRGAGRGLNGGSASDRKSHHPWPRTDSKAWGRALRGRRVVWAGTYLTPVEPWWVAVGPPWLSPGALRTWGPSVLTRPRCTRV